MEAVDTPPQLVGDGRVVYSSAFADGSWQAVVQKTDGSGRHDLLTSAQKPGLALTDHLLVREARGVLVLLDGPYGLLPDGLELVPLDGSAPVSIDAHVLSAQVSADGSRVNYTRRGDLATDPGSVRTSMILTPAPQTLGTFPASVFEYGVAERLSRSASPSSNVPFFYLATQSGTTQSGDVTNVAQPFGTVPANAPSTVQTDFQNALLDFTIAETSDNGRYVAFSGWNQPALVDTTTGTVTNDFVHFSPDHGWFVTGIEPDPFGSTERTFFALHNQDGTSHALSLHQNIGFGIWSADSGLFIAAVDYPTSNPSSDCPYGVFSTATTTMTMHTSPGCVLNAGTLLSITADDASAVAQSDQTALYTVELATESMHPLVASANTYQFMPPVDTGTGLLFSDGFAFAHARYDGTGYQRLDTPRPDEAALAASLTSSSSNPSGYIAWDAPSHRAVFEPGAAANALVSTYAPPRALASARLTSPGTTLLTNKTKATAMIGAFSLFPTDSVVLFDSVLGSVGCGW